MDQFRSGHEINLPDVLIELDRVFDQYEGALVQHNISVLDKLFWNNPMAVRYGVTENTYGGEAIRVYRMTCTPVSQDRQIIRKMITSFGRDFGIISVEFTSPDTEKIGRQMQTWVRFPEGWRIVAAHVSVI